MAANDSGLCDYDEYVQRESSIYVIGFVGWYCKRSSPYLSRRNGVLVFISVFGQFLCLLTGAFNRYQVGYLGCLADLTIYFMVVPVVVWPLNVRLIIWVNKIRFNYSLAKAVAMNGLQEINTNTKELNKQRFYASYRFGLLLTFCGLFPLFAGTFSLVLSICTSECNDYSSVAVILFLLYAFLMVSLAVYLLRQYRDVPDLIGIRTETKHGYFACAAISIFALVMQYFDIGNFEQESPQTFDWAIVIDFGFTLAFFYTVPLQVYRAYTRPPVDDLKKKGLKDLLNTPRGAEIFELYLATELSLENILFYKTVNLWKKKFNENLTAAKRNSRKIYELYLVPGSDLEVNIGHSLRQEIECAIIDEEISINQHVFDEAAREVFELMAENSYSKFFKTDFYKLYIGEIGPDEFTWIQSTGVSSYVQLSEIQPRLAKLQKELNRLSL